MSGSKSAVVRSLHWIAVALLVAGGAGIALYVRDMGRAYDRIRGSALVETSYGRMEFRQGGAGLPVLVIHGSGGGFDQGAMIARAVLGEGFRWIAPSRFGYLRSELPPGASFDAQAHAYAELLDALGIDRVAVVALSHGGPSALLFAVLHPERVSSLTLISCGVASSKSAEQAQANRRGDMLTTIFSHDPLYWGVSTFLRPTLMELMGANATVVAGLGGTQRELIDDIIDAMNPVAPRAAGVAFDNTAQMPNERIAAIRAPTLILHARDDTLQLPSNATFAARTIAGSRIMWFEHGGHLLIAVEQPAVRAAVQAFIRAHAPE